MTDCPQSTELTWEGHLSLPLKLKGHDDNNDTQDEKDDDEQACSSTHCPTHSNQVAVVSTYCSDIKVSKCSCGVREKFCLRIAYLKQGKSMPQSPPQSGMVLELLHIEYQVGSLLCWTQTILASVYCFQWNTKCVTVWAIVVFRALHSEAHVKS